MTKRVHCGRLIINKGGVVKKVELSDGGGTRDCIWDSIDMDFDEMHEQLREKFSIDPKKKSFLYDFQRKEIDKDQFRTFYEYINKNGLQFNGTLLYLCTLAIEVGNAITTPAKRKTTTTTLQVVQYPPPAKKKIIPQVEADSSTSPVLIKIDDEPQFGQKRTNESSLSNQLTENLRISFSDYSFEKSLNELVDYLRNLITRNTRENIFIQIFEHICTIRGHSSITLDRLKQQLQSTDKQQQQQQQQIYNDVLDQIEKLARSVRTLIELNKMKLAHNNQYSLFMDLFEQFDRNFNILRDQWINYTKSNRTSASSSSSNMNHSTNPATSFPSSHSGATSSSRHHHETNSRKQARGSSRSPHRQSSHRASTEADRRERHSLFEEMLKSLSHLSDELYHRDYMSFYYAIQSTVDDIKCFRSIIKLSDYRSLRDAVQMIKSTEKRLTKRMNDEYNRVAPFGVNRNFDQKFIRTLDAIRHILTSLYRYQSQVDNTKRPRKSHRSSPLPSSSSVENKPIVVSDQQDIKMDEDDQSSEASHSSFGDEVLMEVAKDAYEQRPNLYK